MKITTEQLKIIIKEELDNALLEENIFQGIKKAMSSVFGKDEPESPEEAAKGFEALEKEMGRRDFIKKFGTGLAGLIGTGGLVGAVGDYLGKQAAYKVKKAAEPKDKIVTAAGGGKPKDMMPGLVPGDKGMYIWEISPLLVDGQTAVYLPVDQLPDSYMLPAERLPLSIIRNRIMKIYSDQEPEALMKMLMSTGPWIYSDQFGGLKGFDDYPGVYWPEDQEPPQPEAKGMPMMPPNWSTLFELWQLKVLARSGDMQDMSQENRTDAMRQLGIYDESQLFDMQAKAKKLKKSGMIKESKKKIKIKVKRT